MRVLIKIGSALIGNEGRIDTAWLESKVNEVADLSKQGSEIVIVSSGAVAAGMEVEGLAIRPKDVLKLQLLAGEGQIKLMKYYKDFFMRKAVIVAQVLLTHHNFSTKKEVDTIRSIMNAYLKQGTIPIVNENDLVNKEELEYRRIFTDNDILAALVALELEVDLAVLLTDVDGLCSIDPKLDSRSELIEVVEIIDEKIKRMSSRETNSMGMGGMYSKLQAAEMMVRKNIDVIVANGRHRLEDIIYNRKKRTLFKRYRN